MGANSTIYVTRSAARQYIMRAIMDADDGLLSNLMDELLRERLYNVNIVRDGDANDDTLL